MNFKEKIKPYIHQDLLDAFGKLKVFMLQIKLFFAGIYFTYFVKFYKKNGITLIVPFELTDFRFRGRFVYDLYEKEESTHLTKYLSPDAKVLELGSCLGFVSCLTNKILNAKTNHVVLEANPNLISWIEKNKIQNDCGFTVENCIISNEKENVFYIHPLIVGGSTKRATPVKTIVEGTSIADLIRKYNINFDTLIMDIEGGELDLFRNHSASIQSFNRIFFEVHPFANILTKAEAKECEDILFKLGFHNILRIGNFQIWENTKTIFQ